MEPAAEIKPLVTSKEVRHARGKLAVLERLVEKVTTCPPELERCLDIIFNFLQGLINRKDPFSEEHRRKLDTAYGYLRKLEDVVIRVIIRKEDVIALLEGQAALEILD